MLIWLIFLSTILGFSNLTQWLLSVNLIDWPIFEKHPTLTRKACQRLGIFGCHQSHFQQSYMATAKKFRIVPAIKTKRHLYIFKPAISRPEYPHFLSNASGPKKKRNSGSMIPPWRRMARWSGRCWTITKKCKLLASCQEFACVTELQ